MAGGVVILAVLAERRFGCQVSRRQWSGVILGAVGLSLLAITLPEIRGAHAHFSPAVIATFEALLLAVSVLLLLCPRVRVLADHDGALIGAASGVLFATATIAIKALLGVAPGGIAAVLLSPWLLVAIGAGVVAQYVSARSLQTGDAVSVTAMTGLAVNIANIAGGIIIFGDPVARGLPGTIAEATAFALICAAALLTPAPTAPSNASMRLAAT
jgi:hypothetical protein